MQRRDLNIKPSCAHEIHGLTPAQAAQLWEKITFLTENPLPDGKLKKKLKAQDDLYRLRVGDLRVFYTFGEDWIRLLAIRRRQEDTYADKTIVAETPKKRPPKEEVDIDALSVAPKEFQFSTKKSVPAPSRLPISITPEWLTQLKLPAEHFPSLIICETEEALLSAGVPDFVLQRVVDNLFPKALSELLAQPDLAVQDPNDLAKLKEGTLFSFLLRLDAAQERLTTWALQGPTMVRGGAGTGKSTVALYRVRALLRSPNAKGDETVLFTTYTRALQNASVQLLSQLLTPEEMKRVRVATCDELAREVVQRHRPIGEIAPSLLAVLQQAREGFLPPGPTMFERKLRARALAKIPERYLLDEIEWLLEGRGLTSLEEYLESARTGRGIAFGEKLRTCVWGLYEAYREQLKQKKYESFSALRQEALEYVTHPSPTPSSESVILGQALARPGDPSERSGTQMDHRWSGTPVHSKTRAPRMTDGSSPKVKDGTDRSPLPASVGPFPVPRSPFLAFNYVMVDEAQDLPPVALRFLAHLCQGPEGLFFTADAKQSLYSRGAGWAMADPRLQFKGRTAVLEQNYRSTEEIDAAAFSLLADEEEERVASKSPNHGPKPILLRKSKAADEATWAARFLQQMARHLRMQVHASAVLVPTQETGERIATQLTNAGVPARFFTGRALDLQAQVVKVLTMHSAKGLEFPTVVVCGLSYKSETSEDAGEQAEALQEYLRLLYVACTRAMRGLMLIEPSEAKDPLLSSLVLSHWDVQELS